jgi:hypothetical protein
MDAGVKGQSGLVGHVGQVGQVGHVTHVSHTGHVFGVVGQLGQVGQVGQEVEGGQVVQTGQVGQVGHVGLGGHISFSKLTYNSGFCFTSRVTMGTHTEGAKRNKRTKTTKVKRIPTTTPLESVMNFFYPFAQDSTRTRLNKTREKKTSLVFFSVFFPPFASICTLFDKQGINRGIDRSQCSTFNCEKDRNLWFNKCMLPLPDHNPFSLIHQEQDQVKP